jgi:chromosome partitioning protein
MHKTSILTITNQKGGVGKTTSLVNLAAAYANMGKKCLVVDLDYQGNATMIFGQEDIAKSQEKHLAFAFKKDLDLTAIRLPTNHTGIDILASSRTLEEQSVEWNSHPKKMHLLKIIFDCPEINEYDFVLIDTHPSFDCYVQAALAASHYYLVPLFAESFSVRGLGHILNQIENIRKYCNESLYFLGCLITRFDKKNGVHVQFEGELRDQAAQMNFPVCFNTIPHSTAIARAEANETSIVKYKPDLPIATAYTALAGELLTILTGKRTGRPKKLKVDALPIANDFEVGAELDL